MLIVIVGATGTGKSALSLDLADAFRSAGRAAEIVNADAMQLYRGMDVGTAKLPVDQRRGIPHHLLDVLDPGEEASVSAFQADARAAITGILDRGAVPILVGGSGLYVSSVVYDFQFPPTDPIVRERLEQDLLVRGPGLLYRDLRAVDEEAATAIGPSNGRRLVRALEVVELTGRPFGSGLPAESDHWMPTTFLGLATPRDILVPRLDERVAGMWRDGLVDEARALEGTGLGVTASRAIGYAQALGQIRGDLTEAEAIEQTRVLTRKYARRQVGWFRRYPQTTWLDSDDPDRVSSARRILLDHA
ncbi:tRNA (adenosine(37)-N6)-dimethylallyltransferase MiaA [Glaciihabitans sp. INWT7]|uniref:tRNA (adenosine(37)-N6)-dimethylallyltransferase MiaA n=1 Tax=Glaciihabitans sp. INWT7 TaxID=2596912 RepID=UPI001627F0D3|nr:tRNA (adenosine(37)-N6)-dimethylallyltransferase MiaA [Glaciihabitans sp. INWT7]QNE46555.1 tRNA (adenosine(37)-N6)-dimethylallyltransferase MiaA [Glaciihabitans sp. INWT7]